MGKIVTIGGLNRYHENLKTNVLTTKQDVISDLEDIRSGASAGDAALDSAKTYADGLVKDAEGNVKFDEVGAAAAAQEAAAADATSKTNAAQAAAEATAAADATSKTNAAQAAAEATAAADATSKANAAQAAAIAHADDLDTAMDERVAKLEAIDHEKLALDASASAVAAIVAGADSDFDTLKEVSDWILSDTTGAAALQVKVSENTDAIEDLTNDKQDVISDLEDIRSGAAAGATALQVDDLEYTTNFDIDDLFRNININNYLTIVAIEDGLTASLSRNACEYCVDGDGDWKALSAGTPTESVNAGQMLSFRAELTPDFFYSPYGIGTFTISKKCNLEGNCMSMLFGDNAANNLSLEGKNRTFYQLFYNCTSIINVSNNFIPATTLALGCYYGMFQGCTSLVNAPELPATTIALECYYGMFKGCTSLVNAPTILPATTLEDHCYFHMFYDCTSLVNAPELPATTLAPYCYEYMFYGCTSLVNAPELPATTLADACYSQMFDGCTSLVNAPTILPATDLTGGDYSYMFSGCTSLVNAPELPATVLSGGCYNNMFFGCKSLVNAPELPATTLTRRCYNMMFQGCTSLVNAPELPATTLTESCYEDMFKGCGNLNYIKMLATDISATNCLKDWVNFVSLSGTFVKNIAMTSLPTGSSGIPSGWTVEDDITIAECTSLSITADDVGGRATQTTIYYTAVIKGVDGSGNEFTDIIKTGEALSEEFPQNTSTTDTVTRTISYTYMGMTATTTITQGVWKNQDYILDLNNQWQVSSVTNPDSTLYDGVYESFSNKDVHNTAAIMYIDIVGYTDFSLYIRSYAESNYDYVMVSQLDQTINNDTRYDNTTLVKAHTRGSQTSGTAIDNYKLVEFTGIDKGEHRITVLYSKDIGGSNGTDKGYLLIPKNQ